jgi:hypothetical protein
MTTISRDRIQFEDLANEVNDGNEQSHRDAAARAWESAASDYLAANGGGSADVRLGKDHTRFAVSGDRTIAEAADGAGWEAAQTYIDEQIAALAVDAESE